MVSRQGSPGSEDFSDWAGAGGRLCLRDAVSRYRGCGARMEKDRWSVRWTAMADVREAASTLERSPSCAPGWMPAVGRTSGASNNVQGPRSPHCRRR